MSSTAAHRLVPRSAWIREVGLFALALVVYQASRALVIGSPATAFQNAKSLIGFEKGSGLFVETSIQRRVMEHMQVVEILNLFYLTAHWIVTPLFFVVLYRRRRDVYPLVRNAFLVANAVAIVIFMVFPVAPPRLAAGREGLVDTLRTVSSVDLHGGVFSGVFNPYAAVPSMHFGYAALIGVVAFALVRSWPLRALALAYPAVVFLTIVGTANHYIVDALAGGLVMALGAVAVVGWRSVRAGAAAPQMSNCSLAR